MMTTLALISNSTLVNHKTRLINQFKFHIEFMNVDYCSIFELYAILKDRNTKLTKISNPQIDQIFNKTLSYVERFNKFGFTETSDKAASKAVELRK